jgi:hypothetical protein
MTTKYIVQGLPPEGGYLRICPITAYYWTYAHELAMRFDLEDAIAWVARLEDQNTFAVIELAIGPLDHLTVRTIS